MVLNPLDWTMNIWCGRVACGAEPHSSPPTERGQLSWCLRFRLPRQNRCSNLLSHSYPKRNYNVNVNVNLIFRLFSRKATNPIFSLIFYQSSLIYEFQGIIYATIPRINSYSYSHVHITRSRCALYLPFNAYLSIFLASLSEAKESRKIYES